MNFGQDLQNNVMLYKIETIDLIVYMNDGRKYFYDTNKLNWRYEDDYMDSQVITLQEISEQLKHEGIQHMKIWEEGGLEGTIYSYNNYGKNEWLIHGKTKGYA